MRGDGSVKPLDGFGDAKVPGAGVTELPCTVTKNELVQAAHGNLQGFDAGSEGLGDSADGGAVTNKQGGLPGFPEQ